MGPQVDTPGAKHNAAGVESYNVGDWGGAKKHFEAAITADPGHPEPHYNLGLVLDKLGAHAEATAHFKKAAELDPGNPEVIKSDAYERHVSPPVGFGASGY
jgi:Flp pilus assembly protein TadD